MGWECVWGDRPPGIKTFRQTPELRPRPTLVLCAPADNGFSDFDTLRSDPDLESMRGAELEFLLLRYQVCVCVFSCVYGLFAWW